MSSVHNLCTYEFILVYIFVLLSSLLARSSVLSKDQKHSFLAFKKKVNSKLPKLCMLHFKMAVMKTVLPRARRKCSCYSFLST